MSFATIGVNLADFGDAKMLFSRGMYEFSGSGRRGNANETVTRRELRSVPCAPTSLRKCTQPRCRSFFRSFSGIGLPRLTSWGGISL